MARLVGRCEKTPLKGRYACLLDAELALLRIEATADSGEVRPIRAYACASCGDWHLTKQKPR